MSFKPALIGSLLIAGVSLSSCSDKSEGDPFANADLAAALDRSEGRFGKGYEEKARADPNSEPAPIRANDMAPVSYTAEPIPLD